MTNKSSVSCETYTIDVTYEYWSYHQPLDNITVHSPNSEYTCTHKVKSGVILLQGHKCFVHIIRHTHIHPHIRLLSAISNEAFPYPWNLISVCTDIAWFDGEGVSNCQNVS